MMGLGASCPLGVSTDVAGPRHRQAHRGPFAIWTCCGLGYEDPSTVVPDDRIPPGHGWTMVAR